MTEISKINQKAYSIQSSVQLYTVTLDLQKSEKVILDLLKDRLPSMRMLDIGVGAGRTTALDGAPE